MRSHKIQKIDSSSEYPCPCRRKGNLKPIVLTEALGCDRCQQIFEIKKDGQVIEQLVLDLSKKNLGNGREIAGKTCLCSLDTKLFIRNGSADIEYFSYFVAVIMLPHAIALAEYPEYHFLGSDHFYFLLPC